MHGFLELGMMALLSIDNTPYPPPQQHYLLPSLKWELTEDDTFFIGGVNSSRCNPARWNRFRPITALWDVHAGVRKNNVVFKLGHVSEHGIDKTMAPTESRDYAELTYKVIF